MIDKKKWEEMGIKYKDNLIPWWKQIVLSEKKIAWSNLNLLEILLDIKRDSIKVEMAKNGFKASIYEDVVKYIRMKIN
jgi:hypothetical protein